MSYAYIAVAVAATAVSAYSSYASAKQSREVAHYNAEVAEKSAEDATNRGAIAAAEHRQKVRKLIGTQRASMASGGGDIDSGSNLDIQAETAGMGELDALRLLNNAQRESAGYQTKSVLSDYEAKQANRAGNINMASSVLGGASKAAGSYNR